MKYSEAIKLLEENPNNVVMAQCAVMGGWIVRMSVVRGISRYFHFEVLEGGKVIDESSCAGGFNGNVALNLDWQLVRKPVTWQEAIQAWGEGRKIRIKNRHGGESFCSGGVGALINVTHDELVHGTWYVEG